MFAYFLSLQWGCSDCGAGVGRVTEHLLLHHFAEVDLVEPSGHLLEAAQARLSSPGGSKTSWPKHHRAVNFWQQGLEQLNFQPARCAASLHHGPIQAKHNLNGPATVVPSCISGFSLTGPKSHFATQASCGAERTEFSIFIQLTAGRQAGCSLMMNSSVRLFQHLPSCPLQYFLARVDL